MKSGAYVSELNERDLVTSFIKIKIYALHTYILIALLINNQSQTKQSFVTCF